jgi:hypothetical protein
LTFDHVADRSICADAAESEHMLDEAFFSDASMKVVIAVPVQQA